MDTLLSPELKMGIRGIVLHMPPLFWKSSKGTASKLLLMVDKKLCFLHCSDGRQEGHVGRVGT